MRSPSQRVKRKPEWHIKDCYFTAEEAAAGDPIVVDDPAQETTDDELADGWDDDDKEEFNPNADIEDNSIEDEGDCDM